MKALTTKLHILETTDIQTEEIFLPTDDIDLLAVSDEYLSAYSSLYHKYLQSDYNKFSIYIDFDRSKYVEMKPYPVEAPNYLGFFYPVIDDNIKCYDDLKKIFTEYCTDEYADHLLGHGFYGVYKDYEGKLYWYDTDQGSATPIGCYIDKCTVDKNKMYVDIIEIGADNKIFTKGLSDEEIAEKYPFSLAHDTQFQATMVWNGEKWLIEDCGDEITLGMCYSSEITMSQNGRVADTTTAE